MARLKRAYVFFGISLVILLGHYACSKARASLCVDKSNNCAVNLLDHPLFDTEYKIASLYLPVLALRGLAHADVYYKKKSAHLERYYYLKNSNGKLTSPYQTMILDIDIDAQGLFGRRIIAKGHINDLPLYYENEMKCSLPKNAQMSVKASLDGTSILKLKIDSDGTKLTNDVSGVFLGRTVSYKTDWRDTVGSLAGFAYKIHTEGVSKDKESFVASSTGLVGAHNIKGEGSMVRPGYYEFAEYYGPILVKSFLTVKDNA